MERTTAMASARELHALAASLELGEDAPVRVSVRLSPALDWRATEADRVELVDGLAALFGMSARSTMVTADYWLHRAVDDGGGFRLAIDTEITTPKRCACGAECNHDSGSEELPLAS